MRASADDCSELPPEKRSRAGRGGCCPDGFGDDGVLVSAQSGAVEHSTLTVAAFNPFTGPDGAFGPEMMAGCLAAATAVNAAGGVLSNKVACSAVDTRGDPADAVTGAAKMLATTSHLFGVLGPSSDEADSTAPLINAAKIPMFADTGEASFDHTKLPYFWRMTPADDVRATRWRCMPSRRAICGARRCSATTSARRPACRRC